MQTAIIFAGILATVLAYFFLTRTGPIKSISMSLPPHEFAYGATLESADAIPQRITQFLSLQALDPEQVRIETYAGDDSAQNLGPLIDYASSLLGPERDSVSSALADADRLPDQKEKVLQVANVLLRHKDALKTETDQDSIIIFAHYGLKQPSALSPATRDTIASLVRQLDTPEQAEAFASGTCPNDYLAGNINIYPLGFENTTWHDAVDLGAAKNAPILEIRFMGLKGVFRYLLDEMTAKAGISFVHLDGETL